MSFNHANVLLVAVLLVSSVVGPSEAQLPVYKGLTVGGTVCCSTDGNCPGNGDPVGAATATLSCTNDCSVGIRQDEINEDGEFIITIPSSNTLNFSSPFVPCFVTIQLPTIGSKCLDLSNTTGILASGLRSTGTGYMKSLGGEVREATITGFIKYSSD